MEVLFAIVVLYCIVCGEDVGEGLQQMSSRAVTIKKDIAKNELPPQNGSDLSAPFNDFIH